MYSQTGGGYLNPGGGAPQQQQQQNGYPGQMNQMAPQPTGYMNYQQTGFVGQPLQQQQPMQQQFTGYPGQAPQLQQQFTGFPGQQAQQPMQQQYTGTPRPGSSFGGAQGMPPPPVPAIPAQFQQPQQTAYTPQAAPAPQTTPQATGAPAVKPKPNVHIPNIRLSFIQAGDQAKFEQLFRAASNGEQALSGQ